MSGPQLEEVLNNAPEKLHAKGRYTCGHFPQSFEYSSVGGWTVTRGAGQNSSYYGKIEDIVISQEYVTPVGIIKSDECPRNATGPSIDQIMMGSEGTFGILTHVTLRVFKYMPGKPLPLQLCFPQLGRRRHRRPRDHAGRVRLPIRVPCVRRGGNGDRLPPLRRGGYAY